MSEEKITFTSFNLQGGLEEKTELIKEFLKEKQPDFLCLQETKIFKEDEKKLEK